MKGRDLEVACSEELDRSLRESGGLSNESRRRYSRGIGCFSYSQILR